jgi:gephyrin
MIKIELSNPYNILHIYIVNRLRVSPYPLTPVGDALALIHEYAKRLPPINVTLNTNIAGAVVAEDIHAREPVPAYRASTMDGYAVNGKTHNKYEYSVYYIN